MMTRETNQQVGLADLLHGHKVVAVIRVSSVDRAVDLAKVLVAAGIRALEITLRTAAACQAIEAVCSQVPEALVGAGTVLSEDDLKDVANAGARFAISPGATPQLYEAASGVACPLIPGVATSSELMRGLEMGYHLFKFFPAQASGGIDVLNAWTGPFPRAQFIPTGGITPANAMDYLALPNVLAIGGSWMVPQAAIEEGDWTTISRLAAGCGALQGG